MDKLEQAMQSEDFWVELADTSFGEVVLHGKNTNSIADNEYYEVSSEIDTLKWWLWKGEKVNVWRILQIMQRMWVSISLFCKRTRRKDKKK